MSGVDNGLILRPRVDLALNNIGILGLRAAINEGWTLFEMAGGWMDEFENQIGVSTAAIEAGEGVAIGSMTLEGGLAAAFDGAVGSAGGNQTAASTGGGGSIGKDWGEGQSRTIAGFRFYGPNDVDIEGGAADVAMAWTLEGSTDGAGWTMLWADTVTDTGPGQIVEVLSGVDASTPYRMHRVSIATGTASGARCAELEFLENNEAASWGATYDGAGDFYTLTGAGARLVSSSYDPGFQPVVARAVILADPDTGAVLNADLIAEFSRDGGATWATGTLAKLGDYSATVEIWEAAEADISGQPAGQNLRFRLRSPTGTAATVHAWYIQAR